jgi:hypothetical protein
LKCFEQMKDASVFNAHFESLRHGWGPWRLVGMWILDHTIRDLPSSGNVWYNSGQFQWWICIQTVMFNNNAKPTANRRLISCNWCRKLMTCLYGTSTYPQVHNLVNLVFIHLEKRHFILSIDFKSRIHSCIRIRVEKVLIENGKRLWSIRKTIPFIN